MITLHMLLLVLYSAIDYPHEPMHTTFTCIAHCEIWVVVVVSQFNGTSTPKGPHSTKTGDNDCNVNSSRYSLRTALCESIRYQAKSEQNVQQDLIPRERHVKAALMNPWLWPGIIVLMLRHHTHKTVLIGSWRDPSFSGEAT